MKRLVLLAMCCALATFLGASQVEAKCTARRVFKFDIKRTLNPGDTGVELQTSSGQGLGCFILTSKKDADLCAGADASAHLFQIIVHNRCDKSVEGAVFLVPDTADPLEFDADDTCMAAMTKNGYPFDLPQNRQARVLCQSKPYPKDEISLKPDYSASYSIKVSAVNTQAAANGLFDPRVAVERDGDTTTFFPYWIVLTGWMGLGALVGWYARKWWTRGGQKVATGQADKSAFL
jgi:hypothetical protein